VTIAAARANTGGASGDPAIIGKPFAAVPGALGAVSVPGFEATTLALETGAPGFDAEIPGLTLEMPGFTGVAVEARATDMPGFKETEAEGAPFKFTVACGTGCETGGRLIFAV
jgi:hypothetical protein